MELTITQTGSSRLVGCLATDLHLTLEKYTLPDRLDALCDGEWLAIYQKKEVIVGTDEEFKEAVECLYEHYQALEEENN